MNATHEVWAKRYDSEEEWMVCAEATQDEAVALANVLSNLPHIEYALPMATAATDTGEVFRNYFDGTA